MAFLFCFAVLCCQFRVSKIDSFLTMLFRLMLISADAICMLATRTWMQRLHCISADVNLLVCWFAGLWDLLSCWVVVFALFLFGCFCRFSGFVFWGLWVCCTAVFLDCQFSDFVGLLRFLWVCFSWGALGCGQWPNFTYRVLK